MLKISSCGLSSCILGHEVFRNATKICKTLAFSGYMRSESQRALRSAPYESAHCIPGSVSTFLRGPFWRLLSWSKYDSRAKRMGLLHHRPINLNLNGISEPRNGTWRIELKVLMKDWPGIWLQFRLHKTFCLLCCQGVANGKPWRRHVWCASWHIPA